jgi:hypothetical protein
MMALVQGLFTACNDGGEGRGQQERDRQREREREKTDREREGGRRRRKNAKKICNTGIQISSLFLFCVCILHAQFPSSSYNTSHFEKDKGR